MLPAAVRMRRREDFAATQRRGRRIGQRSLVVHMRAPDAAGGDAAGDRSGSPAPGSDATRVGFVVGRSVGNAVIRHRVQRRLRHVVRERLDTIPVGAHVVVRALPAAAGRPSTELAADFSAAIRRFRPRSST